MLNNKYCSSYTCDSNKILKRDFGLRKGNVLLKLMLVETYLNHCF